MSNLPGKLIVFILVTLSFLIIIKKNIAVAQQEPFVDYTPQRDTQETTDAENQAKSTGTSQVYDGAVVERETNMKVVKFAKMIGCIDSATCDHKKTALGNIAIAIGSIYSNPPASGIYYAYDLLENSGIIAKPAYAQGLGFAGLSPILPLWKVTRNIAYSAIIIIMRAIGFMVIFRMKIDPKTVITIQAAIPKIVITLLLITLSYPIAGFMVDLMYLSMAIIINLMANGFHSAKPVAEMQSYFLTADFGDLFKTIFSGGFSTLDDFFKRNMTAYALTGSSIGAISAIFVSGWWAAAIGAGGIGALFILLLFLGLLFTFIRIFLLLLNSYIQLLIGIVLGPLHLLLEAIPGRSAFTDWLLNILANLVVFPATVAVLMFAEFLTTANTNTSGLFAPPFIGFPGLPNAPGFGAFGAFLGLGVLFLAPTLIATIKKQFHPKPFLPITTGTAFAPLTGATQTTMGAASQFYYAQSAFQSLGGLFGKGGKKDH